MPKINNANYRKFLDKGEIDLISPADLKAALGNVKGINNQYVKEGRALLIALYFTGGRPIEVLNLQAKNVHKWKSYLAVEMQTAKRGKPRIIYLRQASPMVIELYNYAITMFPDMYLFYHYRSSDIKTVKVKDGTTKEYNDVAGKLTYHVKQWFKGVVTDSIPPYFLRHNRFSSMAQRGVSMNAIQQFKGAKTSDSVQAYIHLSTEEAEKVAKNIV